MPQYKQSDITTPFWATNDGFKGGRDPMGIQNSSVATYSRLLPGMTNLTGHIRYYSLYCWLLNEYDKLEIHQYNFIRRAELAMALIMKNQNIGSVVGALFVSQERYNLIEEGLYDLADGGDYDSKDKYWTYQTGAFGQYYLGSLIYYELVKIEEGRFYLRDKGKSLASAFRKSVDEDARDLFIDCIVEGSLAEDEIEELLPLGLNRIEVNSAEWVALNHLLTMNADKDDEYDASFGWYFYYLCEAFHYCIESVFCLILNELSDLHNPSTKVLVEDIKEKMLSYMDEEMGYSSIDEWRQNVDGKIEEMFDKLKEYIYVKDYTQAAVQSLKLLLRLQNEYELNKENIIAFQNENDLNRQRGILSEGLKSYVPLHSKLSIDKYIVSIVHQIMQEHTIIAIGKMGNTDTDLRKFIFEDGRAVLVEIRYPTATSPRIGSLYNFLQDLSYIDSDGQLTDIAYNYIQNYGNN